MLTLITAPTASPVTLAEAKGNARITSTAEDALLTGMLASAVEDAEHLMGRAIMPQQWKLTLDSFAAETRESAIVYLSAQQWRPALDAVNNTIFLRRPIVTSVDSIKYVDLTGTQQTLAATEYLTDLGGHLISRVTPAYNKVWPAAQQQMNAVEILFTCGWPNAGAVPEVIKAWIKQRFAALDINRAAYVAGKAVERNPYVDRLLDRWRVTTF